MTCVEAYRRGCSDRTLYANRNAAMWLTTNFPPLFNALKSPHLAHVDSPATLVTFVPLCLLASDGEGHQP